MIEPLTKRECEILLLLAQGRTNMEITENLVVTLNTVKKHTSHIYAKLGVGNRRDAIQEATKLGVLPASTVQHITPH